MAAVTGPISSMPGSSRSPPEGTECDDHPGRPAVARVQGETDSFGCEMIDMCQTCLDEHRTHQSEPDAGRCDWCKEQVPDRIPTRDYDEGTSGPLYYACVPCRRSYFAKLREEAEEYGDSW